MIVVLPILKITWMHFWTLFLKPYFLQKLEIVAPLIEDPSQCNSNNRQLLKQSCKSGFREFGWLWLTLVFFCWLWSSLVHFGTFWSYFVNFGPLWNSVNLVSLVYYVYLIYSVHSIYLLWNFSFGEISVLVTFQA